jgi:hypothetical protein
MVLPQAKSVIASSNTAAEMTLNFILEECRAVGRKVSFSRHANRRLIEGQKANKSRGIEEKSVEFLRSN